MISSSSVLSAVLLYTVMLLLICLLNKFTPILEQGGSSVVMLASVLAGVRLVLPFEIPATVVWSMSCLGAFQLFFRTYWPVTYLLLMVWGVGMAVSIKDDIVFLRLLCRYYDGFNTVESKGTQRIANELGIKCPVKVSPKVDSPCVLGVLNRYTIYMPYPELSDEDTEMILRHEHQHIKSRDAEVKMVLGILSSAVWWNGLGGPFRKMVDTALEFMCDKRVTKDMSGPDKSVYVTALGNVAARIRGKDKKKTAALALNELYAVSGEDKVLKQRVCAIANIHKKRTPWYTGIVAQCLVVAVFAASYLVVVQPMGVPSEEAFPNASDRYYLENYDDPKIGEEANSVFVLKGSDGRYLLCINYEFSRYLSEEEISSGKYEDLYIFEEDRER